jgi:hypothetical protein
MFEALTLEKLRAFQVLFILSDFSQEISVIFEIFPLLHQLLIHLHCSVGEDKFSVTLHESLLFAYTLQLHVELVLAKFAVTVFVTGDGLDGCGAFPGHGSHELLVTTQSVVVVEQLKVALE